MVISDMRYELGNIDRYAIAANGTCMENASFFSAVLKEEIDGERLRDAACTALKNHPLFRTKVKYRKQYYLETNDALVTDTHSSAADRFDLFDLPMLSTIYRAMLDLFVDKDNIAAACTEMIKQTDFLYRLRPLRLQRFVMKLVAKAVKNTMQNVGFTYLGKVPFNKQLCERIETFEFRTWPDIGYCCVAAVDFNGTLFLDICENYADKGVVPAFIETCKGYGLQVRIEKEELFEQAAMRVNDEL